MADVRRSIRTRFIGEDRTGAATRSAARNVSNLGAAYERTRLQVAKTNAAIAAVTLGVGGSSVIQTLANLQGSTARLSQATNALAADQVFVSQTARDMSLDLEQANNTLARLRVLQDAGALSGGDAREFVTGLADAFAAFGATAGQQENVIYGLAQALGQGTVQAQELNQVVEPLPGILNKIAQQAGLTAGEYRALIKEGDYLSSTFKNDVLGALRTYEGTAERLSGNIQQTLTRLSTTYKETLLDLNEPITVGVTNVGAALEGALGILSRNIDEIVLAVQGLTLVLAARFGSRAITQLNDYTGAFARQTATRIAAMKAETEAYAQKAARERVLIAKSIKDRETLAVADAKSGLISTVDERQAQAVLVAKKEAARQNRANLTLAKEIRASEAAAAAASLKANVDRLKGEQAMLVALESRQAKMVQLARTEAGTAARTQSLLATRARLGQVEQELGRTLKSSDAAMHTALRRQEELRVSSEKAQRLRKEVHALRQRDAQLLLQQAAQQSALNSATVARGKAIGAVQRASGALKTTIEATTRSLNLQAVASRAAALGMTVLGGAYALIGGGAGVATLAALALFGLRTHMQKLASESVLGKAKQRVEDLKEQLEALGREATGATEEIRQLVEIAEEIARVKFDISQSAGTLAQGLKDIADGFLAVNPLYAAFQRITGANLIESSGEKRENLVELIDAERAIRINQALVESVKPIASEIAIAGKSAAEAGLKIREFGRTAAIELAGKEDPVKVVQRQVRDIEAALVIAKSDRERGLLSRGLEAAEKKLDELTGAAERRKAAEREVTLALREQSELRLSLLGEEQRLIAEAETQIAGLRARSSLKAADGTPVVLPQNVVSIEKAIIERRNEELIRLAEERAKREQDIARRNRDELEAIEQDATTRIRAARDELIAAQAVTRPVLAVQQRIGAEIADLESRAQREVDVAENLEQLKLAVAIQGARDIEAARKRIEAEALEERKARFKIDEIDAGANFVTRMLDFARRDVGQYTRITEEMSDAEKAAAEKANAIAVKQFRRDKKIRKAQAIIDALAAANRAYATSGPWAAAAALAFGFANVRQIQRQTLAGTGDTAPGGGVGRQSSGGDGADSGQASARELPPNVFVNVFAGHFAQDIDTVVGQSLRHLTESEAIVDSSGNPLDARNIPIQSTRIIHAA